MGVALLTISSAANAGFAALKRQNYATSRPWEAANGFSRAVRIGNLIETSLCSPAAPDGTILTSYAQLYAVVEASGRKLL